jgi:hypothetical protein
MAYYGNCVFHSTYPINESHFQQNLGKCGEENLQTDLYNYIHAPEVKQVWTDSGWVDKNTTHMADQKALSQVTYYLLVHR